jgi:hypothetical protein
MAEQRVYRASCLCGAVQMEARGEAKRSGLCHCLDCQKATGSLFNPFVVFPRAAVKVTGETPCGSRLYGADPAGEEIEIFAGTMEFPDRPPPSYEIWTIRRPDWLPEIPGLARHGRDRTPPPG